MKLFILMFVSCSAMANSQIDISLGYEYTSGNYGLDNDTDITTIPLTIQYTENAWRLSLNIPYTSVTGDGSVIPGSIGVVNNGVMTNSPIAAGADDTSTVAVVETQSGIGDISTSVSYVFPVNSNNMFYELTAEAKWGTASAEKNLGTGENDYSLSLYSLYEKYELKPFLSVGYIVMGDTNLTDYNDVFFASAGLMYEITPKTQLSLIYDYQQATINGEDDEQQASLYISREFSNKWSANVYVLNGLSESVADSGAGFTLIRSF